MVFMPHWYHLTPDLTMNTFGDFWGHFLPLAPSPAPQLLHFQTPTQQLKVYPPMQDAGMMLLSTTNSPYTTFCEPFAEKGYKNNTKTHATRFLDPRPSRENVTVVFVWGVVHNLCKFLVQNSSAFMRGGVFHFFHFVVLCVGEREIEPQDPPTPPAFNKSL